MHELIILRSPAPWRAGGWRRISLIGKVWSHGRCGAEDRRGVLRYVQDGDAGVLTRDRERERESGDPEVNS